MIEGNKIEKRRKDVYDFYLDSVENSTSMMKNLFKVDSLDIALLKNCLIKSSNSDAHSKNSVHKNFGNRFLSTKLIFVKP